MKPMKAMSHALVKSLSYVVAEVKTTGGELMGSLPYRYKTMIFQRSYH